MSKYDIGGFVPAADPAHAAGIQISAWDNVFRFGFDIGRGPKGPGFGRCPEFLNKK